jgi:hypothetical protein
MIALDVRASYTNQIPIHLHEPARRSRRPHICLGHRRGGLGAPLCTLERACRDTHRRATRDKDLSSAHPARAATATTRIWRSRRGQDKLDPSRARRHRQANDTPTPAPPTVREHRRRTQCTRGATALDAHDPRANSSQQLCLRKCRPRPPRGRGSRSDDLYAENGHTRGVYHHTRFRLSGEPPGGI